MITIYKVNDVELIPDVIECLTYSHPQFFAYKNSGKLIWNCGLEEQQVFWDYLANFLKEYNTAKEYDMEVLPNTYELWNGVILHPLKLTFDMVELILLVTLEEFYSLV